MAKQIYYLVMIASRPQNFLENPKPEDKYNNYIYVEWSVQWALSIGWLISLSTCTIGFNNCAM